MTVPQNPSPAENKLHKTLCFAVFLEGPVADVTCANLWWRWSVFFVFPCNGASLEWNWQGKTEVLGEKPVHHKSHMDSGSNPDLRGEWPATNRLSHGTALALWLVELVTCSGHLLCSATWWQEVIARTSWQEIMWLYYSYTFGMATSRKKISLCPAAAFETRHYDEVNR